MLSTPNYEAETPKYDVQKDFERLKMKEDEEPERLSEDLLQRCKALVDELERFQAYLKEQKREGSVELRHFRSSVKAELKSLERLVAADPVSEKTVHTLRSSNFPFYAAVWSAAKGSKGVVALEKRFYWNAPSKTSSKAPSETHSVNGNKANGSKTNTNKHAPVGNKKTSALVDIVANDGAEWIKISTMTAKRVIFDMAKSGYGFEDSSDDEEYSDDEDDDDAEGLLKHAEALSKAAKATRIRYRHPIVRLVLPNISWGQMKQVDDILHKIQGLGVEVQTASDIPETPSLEDVVAGMVVDPYANLTETLNIDCTILLALVSDLSHQRVSPEDWHHKAILRQIEMEQDGNLLPGCLWPACGERKLVCTREAATRMWEIVELIGTESEKARAKALMALSSTETGVKNGTENGTADANAEWTREQRIEEFQQRSEYEVPKEWQLPIEVADVDVEKMLEEMPTANLAKKVVQGLSQINKSVFVFGWWRGWTTVSSNRTVAKEIEENVEKERETEEDRGPDVWMCPMARSLVGKEKKRRGFSEKGCMA